MSNLTDDTRNQLGAPQLTLDVPADRYYEIADVFKAHRIVPDYDLVSVDEVIVYVRSPAAPVALAILADAGYDVEISPVSPGVVDGLKTTGIGIHGTLAI